MPNILVNMNGINKSYNNVFSVHLPGENNNMVKFFYINGSCSLSTIVETNVARYDTLSISKPDANIIKKNTNILGIVGTYVTPGVMTASCNAGNLIFHYTP